MSLWTGLRLVVVDLETAVAPDGTHHVVSIGVVTCRHGVITNQWQNLVSPGFPIDQETSRIHGLTDAHVAGEPGFAEIAPHVRASLTGAANEKVVLCAHHVRFDVPILRDEFARLGNELPDLPLLDTAGGLLRVAGVKTRSRKLSSVLELLDLANAAPHEALADATATARAAIRLLDLAGARGYDTLPALLAQADGALRSVEFSGPARKSEPTETPLMPDTHLASHATVLPARPGKRILAAWTRAAEECVSLRCPLLADRVAAAQAPAALVLEALLPIVEARAKASDPAGAAAVLGAIAPRLAELGSRGEALDLDRRLSPRLDPLGRCGKDACPACSDGRACALDSWRLPLAGPALGPARGDAASRFFPTMGRRVGHGTWFEWRRRGHAALADMTLRRVRGQWIELGQIVRADQLAQLAWDAGCRDPEIVEAHAVSVARGGREIDLRNAVSVCDETLALRGDNTDDAWRSLAIRRARVAGQLERRRVRYTGRVDADGEPIPVRRHHPAAPHRHRMPRFLRGTQSSGSTSGPGANGTDPACTRDGDQVRSRPHPESRTLLRLRPQ